MHTTRYRIKPTLIGKRWLAFCLVVSWGLSWSAWSQETSSIQRSSDPLADIEQLLLKSPDDLAALSVAELGDVWWVLYEAGQRAPGRYGDYVIGVRIAGRNGFINTQRLTDPGAHQAAFILSDYYQGYPGGNFAILVSGDPPPRRPLNNPLGWGGFVWEGIEPPDRSVAEVFEEVAVLKRSALRFSAATLVTPEKVEVANEQSATSSVLANPMRHTEVQPPSPDAPANGVSVLQLPERSSISRSAASRAASAPQDRALKTPVESEKTSTSVQSKPAKAEGVGVNPVAEPLVSKVEQRLSSTPRNPSQPADSKLKRISYFNLILRRQVAYMRALLQGKELGRTISLDASFGSLINVIMQGKRSPQRHVYIQMNTQNGIQVGRIESASRYPLYSIGGNRPASDPIMMDVEVRGPDGRSILKSFDPKASPSGVSSVQFRAVQQDTTLRELGVLDAVWWPIHER